NAAGAPGHPLPFEVVEHAHQMPAVEYDPRDQSGNDCDRRCIGSHDECGMRAEIHPHRRAWAPARRIISVGTRRRMISLRMAARCSVRNNSVNATAMTMSGSRIAGCIVDPPRRSTEAGWCSVFHQSTENLMIGILIAPTSVKTAAARAACAG